MITAGQARKKTLKVILKKNKDLLLVIETEIRQKISEGENRIYMNIEEYTSETCEITNYLRNLGYCVTRNPKTKVWHIGW